MEHLAYEEFKTTGRVGGTDQPMKYIIHFSKVVELYQQRNRSCLDARVPTTLCGIAQKTLANLHGKYI